MGSTRAVLLSGRCRDAHEDPFCLPGPLAPSPPCRSAEHSSGSAPARGLPPRAAAAALPVSSSRPPPVSPPLFPSPPSSFSLFSSDNLPQSQRAEARGVPNKARAACQSLEASPSCPGPSAASWAHVQRSTQAALHLGFLKVSVGFMTNLPTILLSVLPVSLRNCDSSSGYITENFPQGYWYYVLSFPF